MKEAIQKAIEGGYTTWAGANPEDYVPSQVLLDPLFWQALGKARGWDNSTCVHFGKCLDHQSGIHCRQWEENQCDGEIWKKEMHRFIDHLLGGKSAESFFKELLK